MAEKREAIDSFGVGKSRMRDSYDLHVLASRFAFEGNHSRRSGRPVDIGEMGGACHGPVG